MQIVNRTALAASINVSTGNTPTELAGLAVAKATYFVGSGGALVLDTQAPLPILDTDLETELGLLPRDDLPRFDPVFEVLVLGHAHAPRGKEAEEVRVRLTVGDRTRELVVFGDRFWEARGESRAISRPTPFRRMPLVPERAFGGTCEILVDADSPVEVTDPDNPTGRGIDPGPAAAHLAEMLRPPAGYPRFNPKRALPNLEAPNARITKWDDRPPPVFWSAVPPGCGLHARRTVVAQTEAAFPANPGFYSSTFHRAHPDWVLSKPPPREAAIRLENATPEGLWTFSLPPLRVLADYVLGAEVGVWELPPQMLVLLPEQKRICLIYRRPFTIPYRDGEERGVRLRTEVGWYQPPEGGNA